MKINNWNKFNESVSDTFSEEMAQEIIYYFSEESNPSKHISDLFTQCEEQWGDIIDTMYETSYEEMKEMIEKLYSLVQTGSLDFRNSMIEIYTKIREERKNFPEAYEIEDAFLDLIEGHNFTFMIYSSLSEYEINLNSPWGGNSVKLEDFVNYCNLIKNTINKLGKCKSKLVKCEFIDDINDNRSFCSFTIEMVAK
jgi:hypothetical protein